MTKSERTRQFIIEKTAPLFNSKGFEGTTLADLTAATGLSKGALYGNFADKEEIAEEAFRFSMEKVRKMVSEKVDRNISSKDRLIALLEFFTSYVFNPPVAGGCPLLNAAVEADDHRVSMRKAVTKEIMKTVDFISGLLQKGIEAGEFKSTTEPKSLAYTIFCCIEGAVMFSRVERSREPMNIIVNHCKKMLDQISK